MSFLKEFKEFAVKGNVIDLAVGVIIGGAFGKIVTSLVNDVVMPLISLITGGNAFSSFFIPLDGKHYDTIAIAEEAGAPIMKIGPFISNIVDFLIIAFVIFVVIKQINRFKKKPAPAPVTTKECRYCRTSIHLDATRCPNCTSDLSE
ncbi:MAG: large conductance mechanosensitive channel protein MscL [Bacteroidales bacterium]|jgi:large conductance mechanosensitive channel|nr:large conductance mechanosensitive channel protein MscL [Bacteroidales bacterium]